MKIISIDNHLSKDGKSLYVRMNFLSTVPNGIVAYVTFTKGNNSIKKYLKGLTAGPNNSIKGYIEITSDIKEIWDASFDINASNTATISVEVGGSLQASVDIDDVFATEIGTRVNSDVDFLTQGAEKKTTVTWWASMRVKQMSPRRMNEEVMIINRAYDRTHGFQLTLTTAEDAVFPGIINPKVVTEEEFNNTLNNEEEEWENHGRMFIVEKDNGDTVYRIMFKNKVNWFMEKTRYEVYTNYTIISSSDSDVIVQNSRFLYAPINSFDYKYVDLVPNSYQMVKDNDWDENRSVANSDLRIRNPEISNVIKGFKETEENLIKASFVFLDQLMIIERPTPSDNVSDINGIILSNTFENYRAENIPG